MSLGSGVSFEPGPGWDVERFGPSTVNVTSPDGAANIVFQVQSGVTDFRAAFDDFDDLSEAQVEVQDKDDVQTETADLNGREYETIYVTFTGTEGGGDVSCIVAAVRRPGSAIVLLIFQLGPQDDDSYNSVVGEMVESAAGTLS